MSPPAETRPCLAFVVTEDWFFVSHFLPMLAAAREAGFAPVVIARVRDHAAAIEAAGGRVIALEAERRSLNPLAILSTIRRLAAILRQERPAIVHCIALRSIIVGGAACRLAGIRRRIYAVTGLGFLAARRDAVGRAARAGLASLIRGPLAGPGTHFLFENRDDPALFRLDPQGPDVTIVGGAGIDPGALAPAALPPAPPLRLAIVARMLWSKGVDLAVEAVGLARARGIDATLTLVGAPDPMNPRMIAEATLRDWASRPGIAWAGHASDIAGVWAAHHAAIMPSRGGEGLPRAMLEAAACGRPVITTAVPGCRDFVRDGTDGFVVPPEDAPALAEAIAALAADPARRVAMGEAIRARLLDGYTADAVRGTITGLYRRLADGSADGFADG